MGLLRLIAGGEAKKATKIRLSEIKGLRKEVSAQVEDLRKQIRQLEQIAAKLAARHYGDIPLPPEELRLHVGTNATIANFLAQGLNSSTRALEIFGEEPRGPILDWGCGSGRTARWLQAYPKWRENYVGCDVEVEAITWLRQVGGFRLEVCGDMPPLPFDAATFSGLFAFSVLTHIPPERHRSWLEELARVLRPDALAYLTTHGRSIAEPRRAEIGEQGLRDFEATGGLYLKRGKGHYKDAAIVTEKHMRDAAADFFEVVEFKEVGYQNQDAYLLRRR